MVNVYQNLRDEQGRLIEGRTKLFIQHADDEGNILEYVYGIAIVPETTGAMFIVDDFIVYQLDRLQLLDGQLIEKDGMTVQKPIKTADELRIEELEREMMELKAKQSIPAAYTEEQADAPLLDYTDKPTE